MRAVIEQPDAFDVTSARRIPIRPSIAPPSFKTAAGADRATSPRTAARTMRHVHRRDDRTPGSAPTRKIGCDQLHTVPVIGRVQARSLSDFIPPYPPRLTKPPSAWRRVTRARRNFLAMWEERAFEFNPVCRLTLRPEGGMPMTILARTEFADAVSNPAALTTDCPAHHG